MQQKYDNIVTLLRSELMIEEYSDTVGLIADLVSVKERGYFTKPEFLAMCKWKEPRQRRRKDWQANTEQEVIEISRQAFGEQDESRCMMHLVRLKGVGIPVASAILTLTNPAKYGVIDVRVWRVLHFYGEVEDNAQGKNFKVLHWLAYLSKLRNWAVILNTDARTIERTLFQHHRNNTTENLYS